MNTQTNNNINKDLILRERLALQRTSMSNDTTLLAFIRTALYFSIQLHVSDKLKSPMTRLARIANGRKHLAFRYLVISLMVSAVINLRNNIREKLFR